MPQSTVQITTNEMREFYYNSLIKKIAEFKLWKGDMKEIDADLRAAYRLRNLFDFKGCTVTLTTDDVNQLKRILSTSV